MRGTNATKLAAALGVRLQGQLSGTPRVTAGALSPSVVVSLYTSATRSIGQLSTPQCRSLPALIRSSSCRIMALNGKKAGGIAQ
jgi:chromate transport protein ChrA